ncbi:hypothetical protein K435DRAFT_922264 [Dendrothele bispora CBS 962.96]|uniref:FAD linked oxidase N-terminal domain-containing protein n=1 Tax=Dendrothele bispora (strain CBS 962.96) TaxID=1314807 RepID=A0A4S8LCT5_DENBC|nr:hypothetical protein K435DRAFT_922264 [Dendrothele bispora CBS 962.96]
MFESAWLSIPYSALCCFLFCVIPTIVTTTEAINPLCNNGTAFAEAAKKYKKDSRKSTGALKEFWDLTVEEGRKAALAEEGRRKEEEEERIKLAVKKAKREVEDKMRRMYEAMPECAKEHTIRTMFRKGPIYMDPATSYDWMQQIADEFKMDVVAAGRTLAISSSDHATTTTTLLDTVPSPPIRSIGLMTNVQIVNDKVANFQQLCHASHHVRVRFQSSSIVSCKSMLVGGVKESSARGDVWGQTIY